MTTEIFAKFILPTAHQMYTYAHNLLVGIQTCDFARCPLIDQLPLKMNHPAFTYGHLALYPGLILEMIELRYEDARAPENYYQLFKNGAPCLDDRDGMTYPPMDEIVRVFTAGYQLLLERCVTARDEVLLQATPGERVARFPVKGSFLTYLLTSHVASHLGQVSAWRRAMKMPPA